MKGFIKLTVAGLVIAAVLTATAADGRAAGEQGAQFLKIGIGTKAAALGGAFVGSADDPSAVYWNPAGLKLMRSSEVLVEQNYWILDMSSTFFGLVVPSGRGHFGVGYYYSSSGSIPRTDNFLSSGDFSAHDDVLSLAYAFGLGRSLSFGIVGKRIHQKIDGFSASTFALDVGLLYETSLVEGLRFGAVVQNIGGTMTFIEEGDELPRYMRLALAYERSGLTISTQIEKAGDIDTAVGIGGEYVIGNALALRAGYNSSRTLSFGTGVAVKRLMVGYAYAPNDGLDASQRISVNIRF